MENITKTIEEVVAIIYEAFPDIKEIKLTLKTDTGTINNISDGLKKESNTYNLIFSGEINRELLDKVSFRTFHPVEALIRFTENI